MIAAEGELPDSTLGLVGSPSAENPGGGRLPLTLAIACRVEGVVDRRRQSLARIRRPHRSAGCRAA